MKTINVFKKICGFVFMMLVFTSQANAQTWDLVPIENLTSTDIFAIVDIKSGRAMSNANGTSAAPSAVSITLDADSVRLLGTIPDNLKWNISGNDTTAYIFRPNGATTWLYSTSSNNGLRVGTTASSSTVTNLFSMNSGFLYATALGRYVGVYNNSDWRSYTTIHNNIKNTKIRFFRYTERESNVATPTFTPAGGTYYSAVQVEIRCADTNAVIHYTTDGTTPDGASAVYSSPIVVAQSLTVKAIAINGTDTSNMGSASYTIQEITDVENIAELRGSEANATTLYRLTGAAVVTFANNSRHNKYIQDATGGILIDDNSGIISETYVIGDAMSNIIGVLQNYNGMLQFVPRVNPGMPVSSGNTVTPTALTIDELRDDYESYEAQLITLTNVIINPVGEATAFAYNTYYNLNGETNPKLGIKYSDLDLIGETIPIMAQNVTGVLYDYNGTYEIFPRSISDLANIATACESAPEMGSCTAALSDREMVFTSEVSAMETQCTMLSYGFVYSTTNTMPELDSAGCTAVEIGNSIEAGVAYSYQLAELGFDTYYVRAYATNEVGTAYSGTASVQQAEPEQYTVTFVVDGYGTVGTENYLEGGEPMTLEPIGDCNGVEFVGWSLATLEGTTSQRPSTLSTFSPTSDTTFHAIFRLISERTEDRIVIRRSSFDTVASYGTPDQWRVFSEELGTEITGWADLYTTTDYMQLRNSNTPHPYNEIALPGRIVNITLYGSRNISTARAWTPYISANALNETNYATEGVSLGAQNVAASATVEWPVTDFDANYFYISLAGGASYLDSIMVQYSIGDNIYTASAIDTVTMDVTICEGMTYTDEHFNTNEVGTHTFLETSENYCGTLYILNLNVATPDTIHHYVDTCGQYTLNAITYENDADIILETPNEELYGCPLYDAWHIHIRHNSHEEITVTDCISYTWNENTYTASGDYEQIFTNVDGCDSIVTLHLTINPSAFTTEEITICESDLPYTYNDTVFEVGTPAFSSFNFQLSTQNGCDSTVTLNLTVNPSAFTTDEITICESDLPYTYNDTVFEVGTPAFSTFNFQLLTQNGCDSTVTLNLTVNPSAFTTDEITICESDLPYTYNDTVFEVGTPASSTFNFQLSTQNGCDSIVTLHLTIYNGTYTLNEVTECGTSYTWGHNGATYTESGLYEAYETNEHGCEDTVALLLALNRPAQTEIRAQICEGDAYTQNGFNENAAGVYTQHLQTVSGCDSTVTLHLTVGTETVNNIEAAICEGSSYVENGFNIALPTAGVHQYSQTIEREGTCDSIVNLTLTVNSPVTNAISETACETYTWNGETYTQSGEYTQSFTAANGCDSVVTLTLTINQPVTNAISETACETYTWNGETYTQSGEYTQSFTAANGCDSVVTLNLTINQPVANAISETACETYTWNGETYTQSGEYTQSFTAANGCDSIVTLTLTINQPVANAISETACETYTWNGETYTQSGEYTQSFTAANGCDSVVTLHLTIGHFVVEELYENACESYTWNGATYTESGDYVYEGYTANGCDSTVILHLTINESATEEITETAENSFVWNDSTYTESGDYTWTGTTAAGCDSTVILHLTITTGIANYSVGKAIKVWPNPAKSIINVECGIENAELQLFDMTGRRVETTTVDGDVTTMDVSSLAPGVYVLHLVRDGKSVETAKVVINS